MLSLLSIEAAVIATYCDLANIKLLLCSTLIIMKLKKFSSSRY